MRPVPRTLFVYICVCLIKIYILKFIFTLCMYPPMEVKGQLWESVLSSYRVESDDETQAVSALIYTVILLSLLIFFKGTTLVPLP